MQRINFGRKYLQLNGPLKMRLDVRNATITAIFLAVIVAISVFALMVGSLKLSIDEVFSALFGQTSGFKRTIVVNWRLPRVIVAIIFGAGLAVSGSIFQSITKNPLGSPDVIGFSSGSYTGVLFVLLVLGSNSFSSVAIGSLIGGFATALIIYLLAFQGGTHGFRLIIVGIAMSTILGSINSMLLLQSKTEVALSAAAWGVGSLNGIDWEHGLPAVFLVIVFLLLAVVMNRPLREMELGEDTAKSHGVRINRTQGLLIIIAVSLTASATAVMGPVTFVALAAPQIALRFTKTTGSFAPTAVIGSFLLLGADVLAQRIIPGTILPVGVVTLSIGGLYLVWLLFRQARTAS
ncbi:MAG: ABC-type enterobactin transport system, permease component [Bacillales bacterium]|nr:ABC-type enterobactin transport system, permease component [Bacillales bacterium]